jgi:hypothetical protein
LLTLVQTALAAGSTRFARQASLSWLAYYPGDLPVKRLYTRALLKAGRAEPARPLLEKLCLADPEDLEAQELLLEALQSGMEEGLLEKAASARQVVDCRAAIFALSGRTDPGTALPTWAQGLHQARQAVESGDLESAEALVLQALLVESPPPLVAVTHLAISAARGLPSRAMQDLAGFYHLRHPDCLSPALLVADATMEGGEPEKAVEMLHKAAAEDVTGQVPARLWGPHHPYRDLWPEGMEAPLELVIPAEVAAEFGWNRLPGPRFNDPSAGLEGTGGIDTAVSLSPAPSPSPFEPAAAEKSSPDSVIYAEAPASSASPGRGEPMDLPGAVEVGAEKRPPEKPAPAAPLEPKGERPLSRKAPKPLPESLRSVQAELEKVAAGLKSGHLARADGRFPVYVIFSTRSGLEGRYGVEGFAALDKELKRLAAAVGSLRDWSALVIYADDPVSMAAYGLKPAPAEDPWSLKLVLADLDALLADQGQMIGALLIAGGPEIVPFHLLPNPVDDADVEVPSDNPYATRDENYFVPEWPVARLPGGSGLDPEPLLGLVRRMVERHTFNTRRRTWIRRAWLRWSDRFWQRVQRKRPSWGYTAEVWHRASISVFRPIGDPHAMLVSPPVMVNGRAGRTHRNRRLPSARLGYFNLHGLQDSSEWYGQREPDGPVNGPDYPVALRPRDVLDGGRAPQVVFSEACYGAHITGREVNEAMALKFLVAGTQALAGSTCTAYGSVTPPLIAADLLGNAFWKYLREGLPAGEALRRAKIFLAKEMHRRQGYLDGEDQKTLITFVLYGDPLTQISELTPPNKAVYRAVKPPVSVKTVCDRASCPESGKGLTAHTPVPAETLAYVKTIVEQYLPGMEDARLTLCQEQAGCQGKNHSCPSSRLGAKAQPADSPQRRVVVLSKDVAEPLFAQAGGGEPKPADLSSGKVEANCIRVHHHFARLTLDEMGQLVKLAVSR